MKAGLILGCALAAIGCDRAIEVRLIAPIGEVARPVSYACVDKLEVDLRGSVEDPPLCYDLEPGQIDTLRDHHLGSLLDAPLPNGFGGITVRGLRGNGVGCGGDTVFHGEGFYDGGDTLDVAMNRALDCRRLVTTPTPIQLLSLDALLTGGAGRCAPPADVEQWQVVYVHVFPYQASPTESGAATDQPSAPLPVSAAGVATVAGQHFDGAVEPSCMLIDAAAIPADAEFTQVCYAADAPRLCAATGAELITLTAAQAAAIADPNRAFAVGLAFDATTKAPIAGATVTVVSPSDVGPAIYLDYVGGALVRSGSATATNASGLFLLETGVPTVISISRPGQPTSVRAVMPDGFLSLGVQPVGMP